MQLLLVAGTADGVDFDAARRFRMRGGQGSKIAAGAGVFVAAVLVAAGVGGDCDVAHCRCRCLEKSSVFMELGNGGRTVGF